MAGSYFPDHDSTIVKSKEFYGVVMTYYFSGICEYDGMGIALC